MPAAKLRRVLTLWDLILYGIILIMPIAPVPLFGVVQKLSNGHAVTTILLGMVAMGLTAFSYGRMAALYPTAGSAYTYVARGLHAHLGFLAGWAMFLDYLLVPLICTIYGALTMQRILPAVPYGVWVVAFAMTMTVVNLRGIKATARVNFGLMLIMCGVVLAFFFLAARYLLHMQGWQGLISPAPFYNPRTFNLHAIGTATALAALTYGGFDGVTTLAEEVHNPRRNVLLATVIVCVFTGVFGGLQVYLAQRVRPDYHSFPQLETAFMDVSRDVGGAGLFDAMAAILILANVGCGLAGQAGVSRLLYGMGRDRALPRWFGYLSPSRGTPDFNICLAGALALGGAFFLDYERCGELINFGAFLAFMGVNAAVIRQFVFVGQLGHRRNLLGDALAPALGFLFCLAIWLSLATPAKILGGAWFFIGIAYDAWLTRGFRRAPVLSGFGE